MSTIVVNPVKEVPGTDASHTTTPTPAATETKAPQEMGDVVPDEQTVAAAAEILVFDKQGVKVPFGDVFASTKTVVVFIR